MKYSILDCKINSDIYKYGIRVEGILNFHDIRNWFSRTYGPCESLAHGNKIDNRHWSYEVLYNNYTVFVRSDEELSWFKIKYGSYELVS